ncbi:PDZ domain-containing protein [Candidatus Saccharibacteria bacterium]|nr:PDZ domain-containing protein [Candidatus Saccharibacteria bacterium]
MSSKSNQKPIQKSIPKSGQNRNRDIIAEANKRLVITTIITAAIVITIGIFVFSATSLGNNIKTGLAKLTGWEFLQDDSSLATENQTDYAPAKPTFENRVTELLNKLVSSGSLNRAGIGIRYVTITDEVAKDYNLPVTSGAYIPSADAIMAGMPAEKAGLRAGDIIVKIDNVKISEDYPLNYLVATHAIGETIAVTYLRDGTERVVSIKLARLTEN